MPRTSGKFKNIESDSMPERAIRVERTNWWQAIRGFFLDRRTRMVFGVLLTLFAVIALLSYISFLFTGTYDQSVLSLDHAERVANRQTVRNLLGLPGAMLAQFLIDGSFGFVSILLVLMIAAYGLRLMHVFKDIRAIFIFCATTFWVLWGSIVLGFAQQMVHLGVFRWGGKFGSWAAEWLSSYVNIIGTLLILIATLVIFLIVTDPQFTERCKAFGAWVAGLFKRKPKAPKDLSDPNDLSEPTDLTIDLPLEDDDHQSPLTTDQSKEVTFTIEPTAEEDSQELIANSQEPLLDDEDEPLGDAPLPMEEPGASPQSNGESGLRLEGKVEEQASPKAAVYGKAVDDIRQAISLGDRFLYQRELFGQNAELMQRTLTELNELGSYEDAIQYISRFNWDTESNTYQQFLVTLHRRFG